MASPRKTRSSKSPSRRRSTSSSRSTRSRSRSRSRSRGRSVRSKRSISPAKSTPAKTSPPKSTKRPATPAAGKVKREDRAVTPTRRSTRLENKTLPKEDKKPVEFQMMEEPEKVRIGMTRSREFGGAIGSFFMVLGLPVGVLGLNILCSQNKCGVQMPKISTNWKHYLDKEAALIYVGWFLFQAFLYMLPIGKVVNGQPLKSGQKLQYRCNGFFALIVSLLAFAGAVYMKYPIQIVHTKFIQLITSGIIFSFVLSLLLYIKARRGPNASLAPGGNTGNFLYDFFIGHELNPRIGSFDLKFFCELRPGLIGWLMINLVFLTEAYQKNNGVLPPGLTMVVVFQALYVADALWFEDAILTTMDIIHDGFGFMLVFGDLVWVPFLYCLQTKFLAENNVHLFWYCLAAIGVLNFIGYFMFRGSNSQKNEFRKNPYNPTLSHLETIPTTTGNRLLVSGWWGLCRKPNYLGDIIMSIAWSLPCGFSTPIVWFYPIYFTILLIHRQRRDEEVCAKKYKGSWDRYCERVPYRIFPKIY
ncbi:delta(14)-sterol reductase TM7SF2-like [Mytilus trossulus]|uniref:delta(14)-sterol reductase TM7SF2-like n=1 Tax=Mytilus trossulus TaxID=6551 RepID=UPI003007994E